MDNQLLTRAAEAFLTRAARGDLSGGLDLLSALRRRAPDDRVRDRDGDGDGDDDSDDDDGASVRAWGWAIRSRVWLACPDAVALPRLDQLETLAAAGAATHRPAALVAADLALAAFLAFDGDSLDRCADLLARLARDDEGQIQLTFAETLRALFRGRPAPADLDRMIAGAGKSGHASARAEGQSLRALVALADGDHGTGLELARRAAMMARTESIPQAEFLANLVLARARRHCRQGHLALRIIELLSGVLTPPWMGWLAWESALADARQAAAPPGAARDLIHLLEAASRGDRARFDACRLTLGTRLGDGLFGREARDLVALLAPHVDPVGAEAVAFARGQSHVPPAGLDNVAWRHDVSVDDAPGSALACVLTRPGEAGRRFLHRGLALVQGEACACLPQSRRSQGRVDVLLAVLALAGPAGLDDAECFVRVYGFNYVAPLHRNVFDVLIHRMRSAGERFVRLERQPGRLALEVLVTSLVVPDPRICQRTTDRVLRLLATCGKASARQAAASLQVSLRAVQGALSELAHSQACTVTRDGRAVVYAVEDTIFSEPTQRFREADLAAPASEPDAMALP